MQRRGDQDERPAQRRRIILDDEDDEVDLEGGAMTRNQYRQWVQQGMPDEPIEEEEEDEEEEQEAQQQEQADNQQQEDAVQVHPAQAIINQALDDNVFHPEVEEGEIVEQEEGEIVVTDRSYAPFLYYHRNPQTPAQRTCRFLYYIGWWAEGEAGPLVPDMIGWTPLLDDDANVMFNINPGQIADIAPQNMNNNHGYIWYDVDVPASHPNHLDHQFTYEQMWNSIRIAAELTTVYSQEPGFSPNNGGDNPNAYSVIVRFYSDGGQGPNYYQITFQWAAISTYDNFQAAIYEMIHIDEQDYEGNLQWEEGEAIELDTSWFGLYYFVQNEDLDADEHVNDHTLAQYMMFDTVPYRQEEIDENMSCIHKSMVDCGYNDARLHNLTSVAMLAGYIDSNNLPIEIIYNNPEHDHGHLNNRRHIIKAFVDKNKNRKRKMWQFNTQDITKHRYYYTCEGAIHTLIYDPTRKHIAKATTTPPTICANIYADAHQFIKYFSEKEVITILGWSMIKKPPLAPADENDTVFCFFDLEAVTNYFKDCMSQAYSVSYLICKWSDLVELDDLERNPDEEKIKDFKLKYVVNLQDFNCIAQFLARVQIHMRTRSSSACRYKFVGFNSSNYDLFMVLEELQRVVQHEESHIVNYVEYHGANKIGDILFYDRRCSTFDIARHLVGSLASLCKSFNIKTFAKRPDLISFSQVQKAWAESRRTRSKADDVAFWAKMQEMVDLQRLKEYNDYDVLALALIFYRYGKSVRDLECVQECVAEGGFKPFYDFCSLPLMIYKLHVYQMKRIGLKLPPVPDIDTFEWIRKGCIGGRCQVFGKYNRKYVGEMISWDITSLYPYAMFVAPEDYPAGELVKGLITQETIDRLFADVASENFHRTKKLSKLGYYTVSIDQTRLVEQRRPLIVCNRSAMGNDWEYVDSTVKQENIVLSSLMISLLIEFGCEVSLSLGYEYIEFSSRVHNHILFGWLAELMRLKNSIDELPEDDPNYNPALRAAIKMMLNALAGKFLQQPREQVFVQMKKDEFDSKMRECKEMVKGTCVIVGHVNTEMLVVKYMRKREYIHNLMEAYVGGWVYDISRSYMFRNFLCPIGQDLLCYHDTDSVLVRKASIPAAFYEYLHNTIIPHNKFIETVDERYKTHPFLKEGSKIFGGLANELKTGNSLCFVNDKKEYAVFKFDENNKIIWHKFSFKGISKRAVLIDNINGEREREFILRGRDGGAMVSRQYEALQYEMEYESTLKLDKGENVKIIFERLLEGREVFALQCAFKRSVATSTVRVVYLVKKMEPGKAPEIN